jgi:hypothetical protein
MECCGVILGAMGGNAHECREELFADVIPIHEVRVGYADDSCEEGIAGHCGELRDEGSTDEFA